MEKISRPSVVHAAHARPSFERKNDFWRDLAVPVPYRSGRIVRRWREFLAWNVGCCDHPFAHRVIGWFFRSRLHLVPCRSEQDYRIRSFCVDWDIPATNNELLQSVSHGQKLTFSPSKLLLQGHFEAFDENLFVNIVERNVFRTTTSKKIVAILQCRRYFDRL